MWADLRQGHIVPVDEERAAFEVALNAESRAIRASSIHLLGAIFRNNLLEGRRLIAGLVDAACRLDNLAE
jgi:hypothetical protein